MSKKIKLALKCDQANHVCDKAQYKDASIWEKIKLFIHITFCDGCRKYTINNVKLSRVIRKSHIVCLDKKCKENMKINLDKAIKDIELN